MMKKQLWFLCFVITVISCNNPTSKKEVFVNTKLFVLPILKGKEYNKVSSFKTLEKIKSLTISLKGTTFLNEVQKATLFYGNDHFEKATIVGETASVSEITEIKLNKLVNDVSGTFWISITPTKKANILHKIVTKITSVTLQNGEKVPLHLVSNSQRIGIALKQKNEEGIHTFRIPGLATTNTGTLIGVYDIRHHSSVDLQADIDVGMSRSTDGGQTWEPMKTIIDMGTYGNKSQEENGVGDPAVLVDKKTNTIWVIALWMHGNKDKRAWWASKQGTSVNKTGQLILVKSVDDGKTWSKPINITSQVKKKEWNLFFNGPGKGITMQDGTLVFAAQYKDKKGVPYSTIIYSKDNGNTWNVGTGAKSETTEAQVVELSNGNLLLNMRDDRNRKDRKDTINGRSIATTKDLGKTWHKHSTSRKALIEPNCMASIISFKHPKKGTILFFSNPNSKTKRNHITVKASFDEGETWKPENQIEIYEENTYGYSCMTIIDNAYIGILYEGNRELYFQKIPIKDFTKY